MLLEVRPDQTSNKQSISQPDCASVSWLMNFRADLLLQPS
jgi:hypothetical protein